jgi:hypothetical protein
MEAAIKKEDPELFATIPKSLWRKKWVTHIKCVGRGDKALEYIARYVNQSALGKNRIIADDERGVLITYKKSGTGEEKTLRLSGREFIRRYLQHVLPDGFKRVRYYGFLSPAAHKKFKTIRELLKWKIKKTEPENEVPQEDEDDTLCCPECQNPLTKVKSWYGNDDPPAQYFSASNLYNDS